MAAPTNPTIAILTLRAMTIHRSARKCIGNSGRRLGVVINALRLALVC